MALPYTRSEAKEWAMQNWKGVCNVILPTFTSDLKRLNPKAIAHDVRLSKQLGFWGGLLVSECGTTLDEMKEFIDVAVEHRPKDYYLMLHASFDTLEDQIQMAQYAEAQGVEAMLLSYPSHFYPHTAAEIVEYTKMVTDSSNLAFIVFAVESWNFGRIHASKFPISLVEELAAIDTAVAVKYEAGHPGLAGMGQIQESLRGKLVISDPMEHNGPAWVHAYGMQWMGTSNYEGFGDAVPRWFNAMQQGNWDEGYEIFWSLTPARAARSAFHQSFSGAKLIHRPGWKYMAWLNGFNGGPLRMPQMRLDDRQMSSLRDGLKKSGLSITDEPNDNFFVGRHPM